MALRMIVNQSSHLAAFSIAGKDNELADLASRSFKKTGTQGNYDLTDAAFLTKFNTDFPLTQDASRTMLRLNTKLSSLVFTALRNETVPTGSWLRLPASGCDIGLTGSTSAAFSNWTPLLPTSQIHSELRHSSVSLATSVKGMQDEEIKSALAQFRQRYQPSGRPSNWTANPTPPTSPVKDKPSGDGSATS